MAQKKLLVLLFNKLYLQHDINAVITFSLANVRAEILVPMAFDCLQNPVVFIISLDLPIYLPR